jgi:hypothetical protein
MKEKGSKGYFSCWAEGWERKSLYCRVIFSSWSAEKQVQYARKKMKCLHVQVGLFNQSKCKRLEINQE